jgi:hypothetical protein
MHEDSRTVGIDTTSFSPQHSDACDYRVLDMAGQAVYSKTHQCLLQRRPLHLLVWRAHGALLRGSAAIRATIQHWLDALQPRIPGAHALLVATHVDAVAPSALGSLCADVRRAVPDRPASAAAASAPGRAAPPLCVHAGGDSARVNRLGGDGEAAFGWSGRSGRPSPAARSSTPSTRPRPAARPPAPTGARARRLSAWGG